MWLPEAAQWRALGEKLLKAGEAGIDSETYNQPNRTSPQHRTKVHCWSIAVLGHKSSPRGFRLGHGVVLPMAAIKDPFLAETLRSIRLYAHNAPHDIHSFANEGLTLDIQDTLQWARTAVPGRNDYGIKGHGDKLGMEQWALGKPARPGFLDMVKYRAKETVIRTRQEKRCACGAQPCRQRQTSQWTDKDGVDQYHERIVSTVETAVEHDVERRYEITEFQPGHERWDAWLAYSIADAVSGIEIVDYLRNLKQAQKPYPWKVH